MQSVRILKNPTNVTIETNSYGKIWIIIPKGSLTILDSQADKIATELLYRFGFLRDITPPPAVYVETKDVPVQNKKRRTVIKKKKVVKEAKGVKKI